MRLRYLSLLAVLASLWFAGLFSAAHAAITPWGDVSPATDPGTWTTSLNAYIGNTASGSLTIDGGSGLLSGNGYIGYDSTATGTVNVTGNGSTWLAAYGFYVGESGGGTLSVTNGGSITSSNSMIGVESGANGVVAVDGPGSVWNETGTLDVGPWGNGTLSITNGGSVSVASFTRVSSYSGGTGLIQFGGNGGTLTTQTLCASPTQLAGTGTIVAHGIITDANVVFDATSGQSPTLTFQQPGQSVAVVLDMASNPTTNGQLGAGWNGAGSMTIRDGVSIHSSYGAVAYNPGSSGVVAVTGAGSAWTSNFLLVGVDGAGTLSIANGGTITSYNNYIGYSSGASGMVTVDGAGSVWNAPGQTFYVGYNGSGTLSITGGGGVNSGNGSGSLLVIGTNAGSTGIVGVSGAGSTWNQAGFTCVGQLGSGTLSVSNGGSVTSSDTYVAGGSTSTGVVMVTGAGSVWNNTGSLYISYNPFPVGGTASGNGTLAITNGGSVSIASVTAVGPSGMIQFGASGGTLSTQGLFVSPTQVTGTGTISTRGIISDTGLVFDASHGLKQTFFFQQPGQSVAVNLDTTGTPTPNSVLGVGWQDAGSLTIRDGINLQSFYGYVGYNPGATGVATVTGTASAWTLQSLSVGTNGGGTLSIAAGGSVTSGYAAIGDNAGATGKVGVDGVGSVWNVGELIVGNSGGGTLSITGHGRVNSSAGFIGGLVSGSPTATGVVTVCGSGSTWVNSGLLYAGNLGSGTLAITSGGSVSSNGGLIGGGYSNSTTGAVAVDGTGSTWTNTSYLEIGTRQSSGTLSITNHGSVTNGLAYIGYGSGTATNLVRVDGAGSKWSNNGTLYVGYGGIGNACPGILAITGGGTVTATEVDVAYQSRLSIDVGRGSQLKIGGGSGTLSNAGSVRILAGAGVPVGSTKYSPILAGNWSAAPNYQAIGGAWDATNHKFTASNVVAGTSGLPLSLNLASIQRALVNDNGPGGTGWQVGASFLAAGSTTNISFTAAAMDQTTLGTLDSLLPANESILSGWVFATAGYTVSANNPVYLSFNVGAGHPADTLELWHYDSGTWTKYAPTDSTYDGTYASFTATSFSGYAMVAVPEPGTLGLLAAAALGLSAIWWRKRSPR